MRQSVLALFSSALLLLGCAGPPGTEAVAALQQAVESAPPHIVDVTAGRLGFACARLSDGTARCWGRNAEGELGNGDPARATRLAPMDGPALGGIRQLAAGRAHACALLDDGTARCWGLNSSGQLGDGTTTLRPTPVSVAGLGAVRSLGIGGLHGCAVLQDGTARCWGDDSAGQLGDGAVSTTGRATPVAVAGLAGVVSISAGDNHSCALLQDGTVRCWGRNASGQIGDGTTSAPRLQPTPVLGLSQVTAISAGNEFTCALRADRAVLCWGRNDGGQLGQGAIGFTPQTTPKLVPGLSGVVAIAAGDRSACAVVANGSGDGGALRCWGDNAGGQIGDGSKGNQRPAPTPVALSGPAVAAAVGGTTACAVLAGGCAVCFGQSGGAIGDGTTAERLSPTAVSGFACGLVLGQGCGGPAACLSGFCVDGVCCDTACDGACAACSLAAGGLTDGTCSPVSGGTLCRAAAGPCDVAEACSGLSQDCPADARRPAGAVCRPSAAPCDAAEACDGSSAACPADALTAAGALCRPAAGACDAPEACTGQSAECPADLRRPAGAPCRAAAGACDLAESCDGVSAACAADTLAAAGTPCRPAAGACDAPEACTGQSAACPADGRLPEGTPCRAAAGTCDLAESCDGASALCPDDARRPAGAPCRAAAGACDLAESCDGASALCPDDLRQPAGMPCRAAASACDAPEACDGLGAACPPDGFAPAGAPCGPASCAASVETPAATCDGLGACPAATPRPCAPYLCGAGACRSECQGDPDCAAGYRCEGGLCVEKGGLGAACGAARECGSGQCVDGVCCDSACDGQCAACNLPGRAGTCSPVSGAPAPGRAPCDSDGSACGGACDGVDPRACRYPGAELACAAASCDAQAGTARAAATCDGRGACPVVTSACGPYACGADACLAACAAAADCVAGFLCDGGRCVADAAPPTVTLVAPEVTGAARLAVTGTARDDGGLRSVVLLLDGEALATLEPDAEGAVQATVTLGRPLSEILLKATDRAGNVAAALQRVRLDQRPPRLVVRSPTPGQPLPEARAEVSVSVEDESETVVEVAGQRFSLPAGGGLVTTSAPLPGEGPRALVIRASDAAGNAAAAEVAVLVDLQAPVLSIDVPPGLLLGPRPGDLLPYTLRVDSVSAVTVHIDGARYDLPRGGGLIQEVLALREGPVDLHVRATSELGRAAALSRTITYDKTAPLVAFLVPASGAVLRGAFDLAVSARDGGSGVASATLRIDGGPPIALVDGGDVFSVPIAATALPDGPHRAEVVARDGAGNEGRAAADFSIDNTPPLVRIEAPEEGAALRGTVTVRASASDGGSGVGRIALLAGDRPLGACAGAVCAVALDTSALPPGALLLRATATDRAGNGASAQREVRVDNGAPAGFLRGPAPGAVVAGVITVAVAVTDPDFTAVECSAGGRLIGRSADPRFRASYDTRQDLDGALEIRCQARDRAGNVGSESVTVTVRNWQLQLRPRQLSLRAPGLGLATLRVRGESAGRLLPIAGKALSLAVPGGSPVPALFALAAPSPCDDDDDDDERDRGRLVLIFDRRALGRSLQAGVAAGAIRADRPVTVRLLSGSRELGSDTLRVRP